MENLTNQKLGHRKQPVQKGFRSCDEAVKKLRFDQEKYFKIQKKIIIFFFYESINVNSTSSKRTILEEGIYLFLFAPSVNLSLEKNVD